MLDSLFNQVRLKDIHVSAFRNIVSLRVSEGLFADLSDDPEDWERAEKLEINAKPEFRGQPIINRPFDEAEFVNAIQFPFQRWGESRFSDGRFGVWYGSDSLETTIHETAYHWRNGLLADAGWENAIGATIERKVYTVDVDALVMNFIPASNELKELTSNDYSMCQMIGHRIHHEGYPALMTLSARCNGVNYVAFKEKVLSNPKPSCYLTYEVTNKDLAIYREPSILFLELPNN